MRLQHFENRVNQVTSRLAGLLEHAAMFFLDPVRAARHREAETLEGRMDRLESSVERLQGRIDEVCDFLGLPGGIPEPQILPPAVRVFYCPRGVHTSNVRCHCEPCMSTPPRIAKQARQRRDSEDNVEATPTGRPHAAAHRIPSGVAEASAGL